MWLSLLVKRNSLFLAPLLGTLLGLIISPISSLAADSPAGKTEEPAAGQTEIEKPLTSETVKGSQSTPSTQVAPEQDREPKPIEEQLTSREKEVQQGLQIAEEAGDGLLEAVYQALALRLQDALKQLLQTNKLEAMAQAQEKKLVALLAQREQAIALIEQSAARRSRALGRLKELGLKKDAAALNKEESTHTQEDKK